MRKQEEKDVEDEKDMRRKMTEGRKKSDGDTKGGSESWWRAGVLRQMEGGGGDGALGL